MIAAVKEMWNGLGKVGAKSQRLRQETQVMPNGISARYQGKAHDGACGERVYFLYAKLGGTAEVESFCPSRDIRTGAFFMHTGVQRKLQRR